MMRLSLLLCLVTSIQAVQISKDAEILSARCKARCLGVFQGGQRVHCLRPCYGTISKPIECEKICQRTHEFCLESCQFLKDAYTLKEGRCPAPGDVTGIEAACVTECHVDEQCGGEVLKCCPNQCGKTCQHPRIDRRGLPEIPEKVTARETNKGKSVELKWIMQNASDEQAGPNVFVIQYRYHVGINYDPRHMSEWHHIKQTTRLSAVLRSVTPGTWYEYRVAAVNANGTQQYSETSKRFKLKREPRVPSPPQNFTYGITTVHDRKIDVTLVWNPPKVHDLPISRYKIYWSRRLQSISPTYVSLKEHKKAVSGRKTNHTLRNLEPDTTYFIQIQTMCRYGPQKLKSSRISLYLTTYSVNRHISIKTTLLPLQDMSADSAPQPGPVHNLSVEVPYYHNGLLKAAVIWDHPQSANRVSKFTVHWQLKSCVGLQLVTKPKEMSATTHTRKFNMYDLLFNCEYRVSVQPVTLSGVMGPATTNTFATPICSRVMIKGLVRPNCPKEKIIVPPQPEELQHSFHILKNNITAEVKWLSPETKAGLKGFYVMWGERSTTWRPGAKSEINSKTKIIKHLTKEVSRIILPELKEGTSYIFRITTLARKARSDVKELVFNTPKITSYDFINDGYIFHQDSKPKESHEPTAPQVRPENSALRTTNTLTTFVVCFVLIVLTGG